jgi:hypothetical protein
MRTKAGILLEKFLNDNKNRWLLCWNGEDGDSAYDCACCMTWIDEAMLNICGCVCHKRIEDMARVQSMTLMLLAADAMGEMPTFFTSYAEKLRHSKLVSISHEEQNKKHGFEPCRCEFCTFVKDDVHRKFEIEGEDNSMVPKC